MTKSTVFAIFMIVLVIGMMMNVTQGQEMCRDLLMRSQNCNAGECAALCKKKWNGNGLCFPNVYLKSCLCTFPCKA
ncbi:hypothetical protein CARUB_v10012713mg [Capsella rubella]|uniref:Knottin scorpion toxin-like domain-containing protein n=1 Tax=Capsella rubella TaxID=81985 RepID=R0ESK2_9BRAS|nr:putative defensin-like protein 119 [Capsella rubella]EOA11987.1 hypothetical protein CARUB_v10012713mg [Capsella rubella]